MIISDYFYDHFYNYFYNHFWSFMTFKVCPMMMRMTIYFSHQTLSIVCYTTPYLPACIWCMLLWPKCYYSCYNYLLTTITTYSCVVWLIEGFCFRCNDYVIYHNLCHHCWWNAPCIGCNSTHRLDYQNTTTTYTTTTTKCHILFCLKLFLTKYL